MRNMILCFDRSACARILCLVVFLTSLIGCGGNPDQRKSGTLATPIDFVEKAGESQGKSEDAAKSASKAAPKK